MTCFRSKEERNKETHSLLFNTILQFSLEDDLKRWQEKQKGIRLSDKAEDCLTNLQFAHHVLLFSTSLEKLREMLCDFKRSTEAVGLGIYSDKTKILSNQEKEKKKEISVDNIKIEVLPKSDSARYLTQKNNLQGARNGRNQKQTESSMGSIPQVSPRTHFERISSVPQTKLV